MANPNVIRYAKKTPSFEVPKNFKKADLGLSAAKNNRNYHIANQVHRQLNKTEPTRSTDNFSNEYESFEKHVDFPWGIFILFLIIDVIDLIMVITIVGSPIWSVFLLAVVLPFQLWYIKHREKKYSEGGIEFNMNVGQTTELKRQAGKIQKINREAAALMKAGKIEEAAMALGAAKRILPKNLRFLMIIFEKIPWINLLPVNSILLIMSYYDNISTVKAMNAGVKIIASRMSFNTTRKYVNTVTDRSDYK